MNPTIKYTIPKDLPIYYLEKSRPDEPGFFKWLKLPFLAFKYARLLKKIKATHSFSLLSRPNYINILAKRFTRHPFKLIISERNYPSMQYGYGDLQSKVNSYLVKKLYKRADLIIGNSKANGADLVANFGCDQSKIEVIYNPIDKTSIDTISPLTDFFDADYFNIISVGRLQIVKNHELLINAVKDFDKIRLYILGEGYLEEKLKQQIAANELEDKVFLLGFDNNPYKYLKSADLFMLGSNHEGFPNVLLEAMSCGLPLLSTNCKSGPDEMMELEQANDKDIMVTAYGVLSPVGDLENMKKGLKYCIDNPSYLDSCRKNVLRRIEDFSKDHILEAYTKTLTQ